MSMILLVQTKLKRLSSIYNALEPRRFRLISLLLVMLHLFGLKTLLIAQARVITVSIHSSMSKSLVAKTASSFQCSITKCLMLHGFLMERHSLLFQACSHLRPLFMIKTAMLFSSLVKTLETLSKFVHSLNSLWLVASVTWLDKLMSGV